MLLILIVGLGGCCPAAPKLPKLRDVIDPRRWFAQADAGPIDERTVYSPPVLRVQIGETP